MRQLMKIPVARAKPDENNSRTFFDETKLLEMATSLKTNGQAVPLIVFTDGDIYRIVDGERRYRAAQLAGIAELEAIVFDHRPSRREVLITQATTDFQKATLTTMERSGLLSNLQKEEGCSVGEVCNLIGISQPLGSKLLGLQRLAPAIRKMLDAGELDMEKAYTVSQEPDYAQQLELAKQAGVLSREALRKRARTPGSAAEAKTAVARFMMPGGLSVNVQGSDLTLAVAIEVIADTLRILKRGQGQGLDIKTQQKVMADTAKSKATLP